MEHSGTYVRTAKRSLEKATANSNFRAIIDGRNFATPQIWYNNLQLTPLKFKFVFSLTEINKIGCRTKLKSTSQQGRSPKLIRMIMCIMEKRLESIPHSRYRHFNDVYAISRIDDQTYVYQLVKSCQSASKLEDNILNNNNFHRPWRDSREVDACGLWFRWWWGIRY